MRLSVKIPKKVTLSYSGGVDSAFGYNFLKKGKREVSLVHFNHGTRMANVYEYHTRLFSEIEEVPLTVIHIRGKNEKEWREERYSHLREMGTVVTCHHKDDNLETRLMRRRDIPPKNGNIIRPFLDITKKEIYDYARRHNLIWVEDPTNSSSFTRRNAVRNKLIPLSEHLGIKLG